MSVHTPHYSTSNIRPIAIFTSYMVLCLSLTVLILRTLYFKINLKSSSPALSKQQAHNPLPARSSKHVQIFAALAILSLGTTWYHMFRFFSSSYRSWAFKHDVAFRSNLELGLWLKNTQLFKEAWQTAVATPARFWWTQQIFFFTAGWSVFLGREGHRRGIPHLWAFMLLGQVVAISFASNLFFLAVLLSTVRQAQTPNSAATRPLTWTPPLSLHAAPLVITFVCVALIPYLSNSSYFLITLSVPHLLLFAPPLLYRITPQSWDTSRTLSSAADRYHSWIMYSIIVCALLLQAKVTVDALRQARGGWGIFKALYEHPAVSSVGWDVIMCWVSWGVWAMTKRWETDGFKAKSGDPLKKN